MLFEKNEMKERGTQRGEGGAQRRRKTYRQLDVEIEVETDVEIDVKMMYRCRNR